MNYFIFQYLQFNKKVKGQKKRIDSYQWQNLLLMTIGSEKNVLRHTPIDFGFFWNIVFTQYRTGWSSELFRLGREASVASQTGHLWYYWEAGHLYRRPRPPPAFRKMNTPTWLFPSWKSGFQEALVNAHLGHKSCITRDGPAHRAGETNPTNIVE